jgi:MscS family membrane protein
MTNRRIYETIGLRYDDIAKVQPIIESIKSMLQTHPDIDDQQTLIVNFDAFGDSSLDFFVYTFTKTTNWIEFHEVKQNVMLKIADIVNQHNADIAYPTQTLKVDMESLADNNGAPSPLA